MCFLTTECVFLLQNVFSYYRMCCLKEMVRSAGTTASMNTLIYYSYYYSYLLLVLLLLLLLLELVRSADLAGDGKLSWTEFCLMMSDRLPVARCCSNNISKGAVEIIVVNWVGLSFVS